VRHQALRWEWHRLPPGPALISTRPALGQRSGRALGEALKTRHQGDEARGQITAMHPGPTGKTPGWCTLEQHRRCTWPPLGTGTGPAPGAALGPLTWATSSAQTRQSRPLPESAREHTKDAPGRRAGVATGRRQGQALDHHWDLHQGSARVSTGEALGAPLGDALGTTRCTRSCTKTPGAALEMHSEMHLGHLTGTGPGASEHWVHLLGDGAW
jgi:hypothetical protein